jgi:hypothetical protein
MNQACFFTTFLFLARPTLPLHRTASRHICFCPASMSQPDQPDLQKLRLCAKLAAYAYASGNPNIDDQELIAQWPEEYTRPNNLNNQNAQNSQNAPVFTPFFTHSWFHKLEAQHPFFKSHAYFCQLRKPGDPAKFRRIAVGFRGTWLHQHCDTPGQRAEQRSMS